MAYYSTLGFVPPGVMRVVLLLSSMSLLVSAGRDPQCILNDAALCCCYPAGCQVANRGI